MKEWEGGTRHRCFQLQKDEPLDIVTHHSMSSVAIAHNQSRRQRCMRHSGYPREIDICHRSGSASGASRIEGCNAAEKYVQCVV